MSGPPDAAPATLEFLTPPEVEGQRLDRALADFAEGLTRNRLQSLIADGLVSLDGRVVTTASRKVKAGERYRISLPPPTPIEAEPQDIPLSVVYEDSDLIVVDKPAGLVVHPAPGNPDNTLVNALLHHCGPSLTGIGGAERPGIVHRIDKDTSGLIVAAKTEEAHQGLITLFAKHDILRRYDAVVWGSPPKEATIDAPIGRDPKDRKRMAVVAPGKGKHAVTHLACIRRFGLGAALIACRLETGRTHQIRVHCAHIGHPLIGDPVYGRATKARLEKLAPDARKAATEFPRQALHAAELGFIHPVTGKALRFESPLPPDLVRLIAALDG